MWDSGHHLMAFVFHAVHLVQMDAVQFADLAVSAWTSGCINHQAAIGKAMTIPGETKLLADRLDAALKRHRKASLENPSDIKPAHAALGDILYGETQSIIDGLRRPMSAEPVAWQWRSKAGFWNQVYSPIPDFKSLHERELKIGEIEIRPVYASPPMSVGDMARVRAETIEECAKVVEGFNNRMFETVDQRMKAIAAEIRTIASGTATK